MPKAFIDWRGNRPQYAVFKWRKAGGGYGTYTPRPRVTSVAQARSELDGFNKRLAAQSSPPAHSGRYGIGALLTAWAEAHGDKSYVDQVQECATAVATAMGASYVDELSPRAVPSLIKSRGGIGTTRPLAYLRVVLNWGKAEGLITPTPEVMAALKQAPSREAAVRLLTAEEFRATIVRATAIGQGALAHCLSTYGWRPITACRLLVGDVDLTAHRIQFRRKVIKGRQGQSQHPLFRATTDYLRPLITDRPIDAPLFTSSTGRPWGVVESAYHLNSWYAYNFRGLAFGTGGIYAWKRWAITAMHRGRTPWPRAMTIPEIQAFTGHLSREHVLRYLRTNDDDTRALVGLDALGANQGANAVPPLLVE